MVSEMRHQGPAVEAADVPAHQPCATGPRDGGVSATGHRFAGSAWGPQRWKGAPPPEGAAPERYIHRGRCGADLETPRAGRHRTWRTCGLPVVARKREDGPASTSLDIARCVEARGSSGALGVPRALGILRAAAEVGIRPTRGRPKNTGDDACLEFRPHPEEPAEALAKAGVSKDGRKFWGLMVRDAFLRSAPHHEEWVKPQYYRSTASCRFSRQPRA